MIWHLVLHCEPVSKVFFVSVIFLTTQWFLFDLMSIHHLFTWSLWAWFDFIISGKFTYQVSRSEPAVISFTHLLTHPGGCECKPTWFLCWIETRCVLWIDTFEPWIWGSLWTIPPTQVKARDRKRSSLFPNSTDSLLWPSAFFWNSFSFCSACLFVGDFCVLISNDVACYRASLNVNEFTEIQCFGLSSVTMCQF